MVIFVPSAAIVSDQTQAQHTFGVERSQIPKRQSTLVRGQRIFAFGPFEVQELHLA
jgi:hypothetical protein